MTTSMEFGIICCVVLSLVAQSCPTLCDTTDCSPPGSSVHEDSPVKKTGVGGRALLQGIFPTQGSNPGLPYCRQILYHLSHQGSPRILEWVAYTFSRGSSQPRDQAHMSCISCIAGRPFILMGSSQPRDQAHISCISCIGRQTLYFGLHWVFMAAQGLSVVVASEAYSSF